jgi:hypothetical protein
VLNPQRFRLSLRQDEVVAALEVVRGGQANMRKVRNELYM